MFCAVDISESEKGILKAIKNMFNRQPPQMSQINIKSAAPFYYIRINRKQCGENNELLSEMLGRLSKYIIPCGNTKITDNAYVRKYRPSVFPSIMLLNSAERLLQKKDYNRNGYSIGIIDKDARFSAYIDRFIQLASVVTVFSDNQYIYEKTAERIYDDYGASIIIRNTANAEWNSDFTVCTENGGFIVEKREENTYVKITGNSFFFDSEYEKLMPEGTDKLLFSSALYELCGVKKFESMKYYSFYEEELSQKDSNLLTII